MRVCRMGARSASTATATPSVPSTSVPLANVSFPVSLRPPPRQTERRSTHRLKRRGRRSLRPSRNRHSRSSSSCKRKIGKSSRSTKRRPVSRRSSPRLAPCPRRAERVETDGLRWGTAYYVAFGPHGPREPILAPGGGTKIFGGIVASVLAAGALFYTVRLFGKFIPPSLPILPTTLYALPRTPTLIDAVKRRRDGPLPKINIESIRSLFVPARFPEAQDDDQGMARGVYRSSCRTKAGSLLRQSLHSSNPPRSLALATMTAECILTR